MGDDFLGLLGGLAEAGGAYALGEYGARQAQETGQLGRTLAEDYATRLQQQAQFKPFTISTGLGGLQYGTAPSAVAQAPSGNFISVGVPGTDTYQTFGAGATAGATAGDPNAVNIGLSPQQQAAQQQLFTSGLGMLGGLGQGADARTQELFSQLQQMAAPEQERQRLALEERLLGQGRLGLRTAQYGGAPEQLALEKAIQEQQFANLLGARQQAMAEQQQQYNIGTGLFGQSYTPQEALLASLQPGLSLADIASSARQYGTGLAGQQYGAGLQSLLQGETVAGNIRQSGLQGLFGALTGQTGNEQLAAALLANPKLSAEARAAIEEQLGSPGGGLLGTAGGLLSGVLSRVPGFGWLGGEQ